MRALSLRRPWSYAVTDLGKTVENRTWPTKLRGEFLVHAAKGCSDAEYENAADWMVCAGRVDRKGNGAEERSWPPILPDLEDMEAGGIVAIVELVDVIPVGSMSVIARGIAEKHGADLRWWMLDQYGFVLANVRKLPVMIPMRGLQKFFPVPPAVEAAVRGVLDGVCPCRSELDNPGGPHLTTCPHSDPNYDDGVGLP